MSRRIGRWTYNSDSTLYGEAGWHLDGTPVVIDFMPGNHGCCNGGARCCRGCYLLYNWPHYRRNHEPISTHLRDAMELVQEWWDAETNAIAKGLPPGWYVKATKSWRSPGCWQFIIYSPSQLGGDRCCRETYPSAEAAQEAGEAMVRDWAAAERAGSDHA